MPDLFVYSQWSGSQKQLELSDEDLQFFLDIAFSEGQVEKAVQELHKRLFDEEDFQWPSSTGLQEATEAFHRLFPDPTSEPPSSAPSLSRALSELLQKLISPLKSIAGQEQPAHPPTPQQALAAKHHATDHINSAALKDALNEDIAKHRLSEVLDALMVRGYVQSDGASLTLPPGVARQVGAVYARELQRKMLINRRGDHLTPAPGIAVGASEVTKHYEFGDDLNLDISATVLGAIQRGGSAVPVRIAPQDFRVYAKQNASAVATVLLLDVSKSMGTRGDLFTAKRTALALAMFVSAQYPLDDVRLVCFAGQASELPFTTLPNISTRSGEYLGEGTNVQHGLMVARSILRRSAISNKHILLITDGEPTAFCENGQFFVSYTPTKQMRELTYHEAAACHSAGVRLTVLMTNTNKYAMAFAEELTKLTEGRAYGITGKELGTVALNLITSFHNGE